MNFIEKAVVRKVLKPRIVNAGDGHCELKFDSMQVIRSHGGGYLHYFADVMVYLPGVESAEMDEDNGVLSVSYDHSRTDERKIMKWFETAVEGGIKASDEIDLAKADDGEIKAAIKKHLLPNASEF